MSGINELMPQKWLQWARAQSLWFYSIHSGCCADELLEVMGCRYDLERFGCLPQSEPELADLLVIYGAVTQNMKAHVLDVYRRMPSPKYVLAIGACACKGGLFSGNGGNENALETVLPGVGELLPVDIYIPGCPPRPEAIMNGLIALQEKIKGYGSGI